MAAAVMVVVAVAVARVRSGVDTTTAHCTDIALHVLSRLALQALKAAAALPYQTCQAHASSVQAAAAAGQQQQQGSSAAVQQPCSTAAAAVMVSVCARPCVYVCMCVFDRRMIKVKHAHTRTHIHAITHTHTLYHTRTRTHTYARTHPRAHLWTPSCQKRESERESERESV